MRPEKKYLVDELDRHLGKSDYVFLTNYTTLTVADTAELRAVLAPVKAEFHVVKNSILQVASKARQLPDLTDLLKGQVAIVVGGRDASGVAKVLEKFHKDKQKCKVRGGVLQKQRLSPAEVTALAEMPPVEILRASLLGMLNTPASQAVRILNAVPTSLLNVLQAKAKEAAA